MATAYRCGRMARSMRVSGRKIRHMGGVSSCTKREMFMKVNSGMIWRTGMVSTQIITVMFTRESL